MKNGTNGLTIALQRDGFTDAAVENLRKLVNAKAPLIQKALAADRLDITEANGKLIFNWWDELPQPEEIEAYMLFITALGKLARELKRVTATGAMVESEKYAFRCFLLRLGFIGPQYKNTRKILLQNLSGSAAFVNKAKADAFFAEQKAKRDAVKEVAE